MPEVVAYRAASWDTPLWVSPNRSPHRYNDAGTGPTQYACLHPLGPWAEVVRALGIHDEDDLVDLRIRLWALRLPLDDVLDLTFESASDVGLEPGDLVADDQRSTREFGERLRADPSLPRTLRVPSAALPGTRNLVVFGERVVVPYDVAPIDEVDVPSSPLAEGGRPPLGLLPQVRHVGQRHPALRAWEKGDAFVYREPAVDDRG